MAIVSFPKIETADPSGLLAIGGDLEVSSLLLAYQSGIFPWPCADDFLAWFAPPRRAILRLDDLHMSRSLAKAAKRTRFEFYVDRDFAGVIRACSELVNRGKQSGTWIIPEMIAAYLDLHHAGFAHSVEAYLNGKLAGGLYGVSIAGFFAGESMFYREPNASKLALCRLAQWLRENSATSWIDIQIMTPHLRALGAVEISRRKYMGLLKEALKQPKIRWGDIELSN